MVGLPSEGKQVLVGETDFDLSRYAKSNQMTDVLALKGQAEGNYIRVTVKTQNLDGPVGGGASELPLTPSTVSAKYGEDSDDDDSETKSFKQ